MAFKSAQEAQETLSKTMVELNELLKSMDDMGKAEGPQEAEGQEGADGGGEPDALAGEGHAEPDGDEGAGAPPPEGAGEPDGDEGQGMAPGAEGGAPGEGGDMEGAMRQQAGELDDQELEMMCRILQEEQAKRHEAGQQAQGGAGDLQMSMKKELASMAKSFKDEVAKLTKSFKDEIASVKAENTKLKQRPVSAPAATSSKTAPKVLDKKAAEAKPMTKSYAVNYAMGQIKAKNRTFNSNHVALLNATRSDEDLAQAVEMLKEEGIEIPAPK
jgi:hypothetical protein